MLCSTLASAQICGLRCEHLDSPLGVDVKCPRLSWISSSTKGAVTVILSEDSMAVANGSAGVKTYRLNAGATSLAVNDITWKDATRYYWRVSIGKEKSKVASFTTNLPLATAKWITDSHDSDYRPLACYSKSLRITKPIASAYITIASAGTHEITLNGKKVDNHRLDPAYTRFDRHILSVMHDVTSMLQQGSNDITVELGNGWYNHQSTAVWFFHEASWRNRPRFAARVMVRYTDGTEEDFATDATWQTTESRTRFSSIYTAEHIDASFTSVAKSNATVVKAPAPVVTSQLMHPIRCTETIAASKLVRLADTLYIYHFPKNIAGVSNLKTHGKRGTVLRLKHGEMLYDNGRVNTGNIDYHYRPTDDSDPFQTDIFTLSGNDDEFEARFGYKGFQYVEILSSEPISLTINDLVAKEMHSDVPQIASLHTSSDYLNRLLAATNNSYLSNLFGYPTDCPQREKNGWTADAYLALETGMSTYDVVTIYEKWMRDFRDEQRPSGELPCIVPTDEWGYDWANGVDWTSATILIPWQIYCYYGDRRLLKEHYESMHRYMKFVETKTKDYLTDWGLGDWIPVSTGSNLTYTTSVYYCVDAGIMAKTANLLGKTADAERYAALERNIRDMINSTFLKADEACYADGTQTELAMALYWNIVPEHLRAAVAKRLNDKVIADGFHLDVGVHGCKTLLGALSDNGYADTAYRVVCQKTYPSWGYWIENGATTLHENWKMDVIIDNSLNHIMFGEVGAWMYKTLVGVMPDETLPAFQTVNLTPYFPSDLDSLDYSRDTSYGRLTTSWHRTAKGIAYTVCVPKAMTVNLTLPDGRKFVIKGKKKTFVI